MRRLFVSGIEGFFALFAHQLELLFQTSHGALHAQQLLGVPDDHFVELFAEPLMVSQLKLQLGDAFGERLLFVHVRYF